MTGELDHHKSEKIIAYRNAGKDIGRIVSLTGVSRTQIRLILRSYRLTSLKKKIEKKRKLNGE
jgi:hypothetical protein